MGNRLAICVPSQILPIEFYLKDIPDVQVKTSLGNTCFLKVARCSSPEGSVVIKVFVHGANVQLEPYRDLLHRVHALLDNAAPNCLMYNSVKVSDNAGIVIRQHVDRSLYERISTRPFLTHLEKTWLAFQLLCALRQTHEAQVYHGDIKSENILVTRWGWLQLTDFAPFKPVVLPDNDPSDFTYFFDTSRRRTCYIAPERFVDVRRIRIPTTSTDDSSGRECSPDNSNSSAILEELQTESVAGAIPLQLTPEMDIFSAGCVLIELFTDGYVPFNLTRLLNYRKDKAKPDRLLEKIDNKHIKNLVSSMIDHDPSQRKSAGQYLEEQKGLSFPEYFYSFLWPYCRQFAGHPKKVPDQAIRQVSESLQDIFTCVGGERVAAQDAEFSSRCSPSGYGVHTRLAKSEGHAGTDTVVPSRESTPTLPEKCEALILVLPLVVSAFRGAELCSSKMLGLETLMRVARFCPDNIILDRVLPSMLVGVECSESSVRASVLHCVTHCLMLVASLPRQEANIFPDYIIPILSKLTSDPAIIVRQALAENVSAVADTALRFLEWSRTEGYYTEREYDAEKKNLISSIQQLVTQLIMDQSNVVKRSFMQNTDYKLWNFFTTFKANDVILTHLITYLNDNQDYHLRRDFFQCLQANATLIGKHQEEILLPLVQQGMYDGEEWVVVSTITAYTAMVQADIISEMKSYYMLKNSLPLLLHPNTIIRQGIVNLLCCQCKRLKPVDVLAMIRPLVIPYVRPGEAILDHTNELCVLYALRESLPRSLWNTLLSFTELSEFLIKLHKGLDQSRFPLPKYLESTLPTNYPSDDKIVMRLLQEGLDRSMAVLIVYLEQHLLGTFAHRRATQPSHDGESHRRSMDDRGEILLSGGSGAMDSILIPEVVKVNICNSTSPPSSNTSSDSDWSNTHPSSPAQVSPPPSTSAPHQSPSRAVPVSPANISVTASGASRSLTISGDNSPSTTPSVTPTNRMTPGGTTIHTAKDDSNVILSEGQLISREVIFNRQQQFIDASNRRRRAKMAASSVSNTSTDCWEPTGVLISHLHEHTARVHRMTVIEGTSMFATASQDGTIKIWDANKTDREYPINRSRGTYTRLGAPVRSIASCHSHNSIVAASSNGSIHVFKLDKLSMVRDRQLDKDEECYAVDMAYYDTGFGENVVVYASLTGDIVGWDLRQQGTAWRFGLNRELITSLLVDRGSNYICAATSRGTISCWDIRYQLLIRHINHENSHHIRRLARNPCDPSSVFAAVTGNNEVGLWDIDTNYRRHTLWASPVKPLDHSNNTNNKNINGIYVGRCGDGRDNAFVVTGGTDCCLRYWNISNPSASKVLAHAAIDHPNYPDTSFSVTTAKDSSVILENRYPAAKKKDDSFLGGFDSSKTDAYDPHRPAPGHRDTITDVVAVDIPQRLLISSDAMGVVKIWK